MKIYPFAAARIFDTPLAIHPTKGQVIARALAGRFGLADVNFLDGDPTALRGPESTPVPLAFFDGESDSRRGDDGYDVIDGVAVIDVSGTLVQKSASLRPYSGMLGYNAIRHNFDAAMADKAVKAIALEIDSPGGEVAGCFDLADHIHASRGKKPILAMLNESAYSAAYAIASAADQISVPRTGGTGSVGVICMHIDASRALKGAGMDVTIIKYGDRKADGNQFSPLSKDALARFQADVDAMGEMFVETVARNRGLSADVVRGTQATTFLGASGVDIGFADAVMTPHDALAAWIAQT